MLRRLTCAAVATAGTVAFALPALAQPLPTQQFPYKSGPVTLASCTLNEHKSDSTVSPKSLRINYYNNVEGSKLTSVTFRVRYGGTPVTMTDTGSFEFKQSITHQFDLLGGTPWTGPRPQVCRVLTATFADGRVVNPVYDGPDGQNAAGAAGGPPAAMVAPPAAPAPMAAPPAVPAIPPAPGPTPT
jgi:hypothetical protein